MKELFGQRLREQRLKQNLTLEQLAEKANLSKTIIKLENYSENISSKIKFIEKKIRNAENLM